MSEVEFEDDEPWLVKRVKLGVWRKGNCFTNFQISRENGFPKLLFSASFVTLHSLL